jgi:predicted signal transduction protein with EAL and GGDEF domain
MRLARLSGDDFAAALPGMTSDALAAGRGQALLELLQDPFTIGAIRLEIRASLGVTLRQAQGPHVEQMFRDADVALHAAKAGGGGRLQLYDRVLGDTLRKRSAMIRDLGAALDANQFHVVYQPQMDCRRGTITGFEALLRWDHPDHGLVSPAHFIPLAEETGQIVEIGAWVLRQACSHALSWGAHIKLAVNLSPVQLTSRAMTEMVEQILTETGFSAERLELEVTETALINDDQIALASLRHFRAMGIEIALDDFGVGYSMLSYLRIFPLDKLKIDHSFVANLVGPADDADRAIFRAIMDMAGALGLRTIAEGIDSEEKFQAVRAERCHGVQGYLIAPPMSAVEVPAFLANWRATALRSL